MAFSYFLHQNSTQNSFCSKLKVWRCFSDLTFVMRKPDFYKTVFELTVRDLKHLHNIITSIQVDMDVSEASRYRTNEFNVNQIK